MKFRDAGSRRRLLAIVVADVVGYSRLMASREADTFHRLQDLQSTLIQPALQRNGGRLVKYVGDGFLADFDSAVDALKAAVEIQSGSRALNLGVAEDQQINFRIGINAGDVIVVPGDVYGDTVNVAARLQTLAEPGGICISRSVRDTARGKFAVNFDEKGDIPVKNIPDPVGTFAVRFDPIAWTIPEKAVRKRRPWWIAGAVSAFAVLLLAGAVGWFVLARAVQAPGSPAASSAPATLSQALLGSLATALPRLTADARQKIAEEYAARSQNKALAVSVGSGTYAWASERESTDKAVTSALEICQVLARRTCSAVARNDVTGIDYVNGGWRASDMARVHYGGSFDPEQIPGLRDDARTRPEIAGYAASGGPKAAALSVPRSRLYVVTGAQDQRAAETRSLLECREASRRAGASERCLLYAAGNQVVLPKYLTDPITPPPP